MSIGTGSGVVRVLGAAIGLLVCVQMAGALPPPLPPINRPQVRQPAKESLAEIVFFDERFEFGEIYNTEPQTGEFRFKNTGIEPLVILQVKPSCGCTLADMYRVAKHAGGEERIALSKAEHTNAVFEPGEEGIISVTFNPKGKRGGQNQTITVRSNSRDKRPKTLRMIGFVRSLVEVDPVLVGFGQVDKGMGANKIIRVFGRTEDFEVPKVTFQQQGMFDYRIIGTELADFHGEQLRATSIEVLLRKDAKPGMLNTKMHIRTNDARAMVVDANVFARVMGDLTAVPARVNFGIMQVGDAIDQQIKITHRRNEPFNITGVEAGSQAVLMQFDFKPVDPKLRNEWIVTIKGEAGQVRPRLSGLVTVLTDIPDEQTIDIPMNASIRAAGRAAVQGRNRPAVQTPIARP